MLERRRQSRRPVARSPRRCGRSGADGPCGERDGVAHFDGASRGVRGVGRQIAAGRCKRSTIGPAASSGRRCRRRDDAGAADLRAIAAARRPRDACPRAGGCCGPKSTVFAPQDGPLAALTKRVKDGFDPAGVLNPGRMWAGDLECRPLQLCATRRSRHRGSRQDPARMRALRLLHRDVPDLCAARRRARLAARAHLPDQGHAGERRPATQEVVKPYRSLPVVPCLHDDLSVRRALHAPRRSRPRAYRENLSPSRRTTGSCALFCCG